MARCISLCQNHDQLHQRMPSLQTTRRSSGRVHLLTWPAFHAAQMQRITDLQTHVRRFSSPIERSAARNICSQPGMIETYQPQSCNIRRRARTSGSGHDCTNRSAHQFQCGRYTQGPGGSAGYTSPKVSRRNSCILVSTRSCAPRMSGSWNRQHGSPGPTIVSPSPLQLTDCPGLCRCKTSVIPMGKGAVAGLSCPDIIDGRGNRDYSNHSVTKRVE